jgi:NDP-sugar pyrophosphorylase family protein
MKAMILAAGMGTRLRPLTDDRPKALVEVAGRTLLEINLARLRNFGVHQVIVNVHHFAAMVAGYLKENANFGMRIEISSEDVLLDTGGGLKKAAWFFQESAGDAEQPFLLHNVDVLSTINLQRMLGFHREQKALVTLAVQDRKTSRYLLFDEENRLCGRQSGRDGSQEMVRAAERTQPLAFSGIHIISPQFLSMLSEDGVFSIVDAYLRLAARGEKIVSFRADEYYWRDLGKPESLKQAEHDVDQKLISL